MFGLTRNRSLATAWATALLLAAFIPPAAAATGSVSPNADWIVSIGDSAISGEAGQWAGNTEGNPASVDALGATAYDDAGTHERILGCHRSRSAEIYVSAGLLGLNLACSGARTQTFVEPDGSFKPGLDFYNDAQGHQGQALMLQTFAAAHRVRDVVVLIGANDYQFSNIVQTCVLDWYLSPSWGQRHCQDDAGLQHDFSSSHYVAEISAIAEGLHNIQLAMADAGYGTQDYSLIIQTYSTPIPGSGAFRYPEAGLDRGIHGCAIWNADADWVNNTVVPTMNDTIREAAWRQWQPNMSVLDDQHALAGHQLCENTDGLTEDEGISSWRQPGAADLTEWVQQVRTLTTLFGPYQLQEDGHPDYWGQLALRNCLRQAILAPVHGGTCTPQSGVDAYGEPGMNLQSTSLGGMTTAPSSGSTMFSAFGSARPIRVRG